jgi:hypothetical protein
MQARNQVASGHLYPIRNPDTLRALRKVVRGLAFYHGLFIALPEDLVTIEPAQFEIPPAFVSDALQRSREMTRVRSRRMTHRSPTVLGSCWSDRRVSLARITKKAYS